MMAISSLLGNKVCHEYWKYNLHIMLLRNKGYYLSEKKNLQTIYYILTCFSNFYHKIINILYDRFVMMSH